MKIAERSGYLEKIKKSTATAVATFAGFLINPDASHLNVFGLSNAMAQPISAPTNVSTPVSAETTEFFTQSSRRAVAAVRDYLLTGNPESWITYQQILSQPIGHEAGMVLERYPAFSRIFQSDLESMLEDHRVSSEYDLIHTLRLQYESRPGSSLTPFNAFDFIRTVNEIREAYLGGTLPSTSGHEHILERRYPNLCHQIHQSLPQQQADVAINLIRRFLISGDFVAATRARSIIHSNDRNAVFMVAFGSALNARLEHTNASGQIQPGLQGDERGVANILAMVREYASNIGQNFTPDMLLQFTVGRVYCAAAGRSVNPGIQTETISQVRSGHPNAGSDPMLRGLGESLVNALLEIYARGRAHVAIDAIRSSFNGGQQQPDIVASIRREAFLNRENPDPGFNLTISGSSTRSSAARIFEEELSAEFNASVHSDPDFAAVISGFDHSVMPASLRAIAMELSKPDPNYRWLYDSFGHALVDYVELHYTELAPLFLRRINSGQLRELANRQDPAAMALLDAVNMSDPEEVRLRAQHTRPENAIPASVLRVYRAVAALTGQYNESNNDLLRIDDFDSSFIPTTLVDYLADSQSGDLSWLSHLTPEQLHNLFDIDSASSQRELEIRHLSPSTNRTDIERITRQVDQIRQFMDQIMHDHSLSAASISHFSPYVPLIYANRSTLVERAAAFSTAVARIVREAAPTLQIHSTNDVVRVFMNLSDANRRDPNSIFIRLRPFNDDIQHAMEQGGVEEPHTDFDTQLAEICTHLVVPSLVFHRRLRQLDSEGSNNLLRLARYIDSNSTESNLSATGAAGNQTRRDYLQTHPELADYLALHIGTSEEELINHPPAGTTSLMTDQLRVYHDLGIPSTTQTGTTVNIDWITRTNSTQLNRLLDTQVNDTERRNLIDRVLPTTAAPLETSRTNQPPPQVDQVRVQQIDSALAQVHRLIELLPHQATASNRQLLLDIHTAVVDYNSALRNVTRQYRASDGVDTQIVQTVGTNLVFNQMGWLFRPVDELSRSLERITTDQSHTDATGEAVVGLSSVAGYDFHFFATVLHDCASAITTNDAARMNVLQHDHPRVYEFVQGNADVRSWANNSDSETVLRSLEFHMYEPGQVAEQLRGFLYRYHTDLLLYAYDEVSDLSRRGYVGSDRQGRPARANILFGSDFANAIDSHLGTHRTPHEVEEQSTQRVQRLRTCNELLGRIDAVENVVEDLETTVLHNPPAVFARIRSSMITYGSRINRIKEHVQTGIATSEEIDELERYTHLILTDREVMDAVLFAYRFTSLMQRGQDIASPSNPLGSAIPASGAGAATATTQGSVAPGLQTGFLPFLTTIPSLETLQSEFETIRRRSPEAGYFYEEIVASTLRSEQPGLYDFVLGLPDQALHTGRANRPVTTIGTEPTTLAVSSSRQRERIHELMYSALFEIHGEITSIAPANATTTQRADFERHHREAIETLRERYGNFVDFVSQISPRDPNYAFLSNLNAAGDIERIPMPLRAVLDHQFETSPQVAARLRFWSSLTHAITEGPTMISNLRAAMNLTDSNQMGPHLLQAMTLYNDENHFGNGPHSDYLFRSIVGLDAFTHALFMQATMNGAIPTSDFPESVRQKMAAIRRNPSALSRLTLTPDEYIALLTSPAGRAIIEHGNQYFDELVNGFTSTTLNPATGLPIVNPPVETLARRPNDPFAYSVISDSNILGLRQNLSGAQRFELGISMARLSNSHADSPQVRQTIFRTLALIYSRDPLLLDSFISYALPAIADVSPDPQTLLEVIASVGGLISRDYPAPNLQDDPRSLNSQISAVRATFENWFRWMDGNLQNLADSLPFHHNSLLAMALLRNPVPTEGSAEVRDPTLLRQRPVTGIPSGFTPGAFIPGYVPYDPFAGLRVQDSAILPLTITLPTLGQGLVGLPIRSGAERAFGNMVAMLNPPSLAVPAIGPSDGARLRAPRSAQLFLEMARNYHRITSRANNRAISEFGDLGASAGESINGSVPGGWGGGLEALYTRQSVSGSLRAAATGFALSAPTTTTDATGTQFNTTAPTGTVVSSGAPAGSTQTTRQDYNLGYTLDAQAFRTSMRGIPVVSPLGDLVSGQLTSTGTPSRQSVTTDIAQPTMINPGIVPVTRTVVTDSGSFYNFLLTNFHRPGVTTVVRFLQNMGGSTTRTTDVDRIVGSTGSSTTRSFIEPGAQDTRTGVVQESLYIITDEGSIFHAAHGLGINADPAALLDYTYLGEQNRIITSALQFTGNGMMTSGEPLAAFDGAVVGFTVPRGWSIAAGSHVSRYVGPTTTFVDSAGATHTVQSLSPRNLQDFFALSNSYMTNEPDSRQQIVNALVFRTSHNIDINPTNDHASLSDNRTLGIPNTAGGSIEFVHGEYRVDPRAPSSEWRFVVGAGDQTVVGVSHRHEHSPDEGIFNTYGGMIQYSQIRLGQQYADILASAQNFTQTVDALTFGGYSSHDNRVSEAGSLIGATLLISVAAQNPTFFPQNNLLSHVFGTAAVATYAHNFRMMARGESLPTIFTDLNQVFNAGLAQIQDQQATGNPDPSVIRGVYQQIGAALLAANNSATNRATLAGSYDDQGHFRFSLIGGYIDTPGYITTVTPGSAGQPNIGSTPGRNSAGGAQVLLQFGHPASPIYSVVRAGANVYNLNAVVAAPTDNLGITSNLAQVIVGNVYGQLAMPNAPWLPLPSSGQVRTTSVIALQELGDVPADQSSLSPLQILTLTQPAQNRRDIITAVIGAPSQESLNRGFEADYNLRLAPRLQNAIDTAPPEHIPMIGPNQNLYVLYRQNPRVSSNVGERPLETGSPYAIEIGNADDRQVWERTGSHLGDGSLYRLNVQRNSRGYSFILSGEDGVSWARGFSVLASYGFPVDDNNITDSSLQSNLSVGFVARLLQSSVAEVLFGGSYANTAIGVQLAHQIQVSAAARLRLESNAEGSRDLYIYGFGTSTTQEIDTTHLMIGTREDFNLYASTRGGLGASYVRINNVERTHFGAELFVEYGRATTRTSPNVTIHNDEPVTRIGFLINRRTEPRPGHQNIWSISGYFFMGPYIALPGQSITNQALSQGYYQTLLNPNLTWPWGVMLVGGTSFR